MFELLEVFGHSPGEKNVTGIGAIHHSLRHVDAGTGDISAAVHINYATHWPTVNPHPQGKVTVLLLYCATDLKGAFHRIFGAMIKDQRHSVPGRDFEKSFFAFRL